MNAFNYTPDEEDQVVQLLTVLKTQRTPATVSKFNFKMQEHMRRGRSKRSHLRGGRTTNFKFLDVMELLLPTAFIFKCKQDDQYCFFEEKTGVVFHLQRVSGECKPFQMDCLRQAFEEEREG